MDVACQKVITDRNVRDIYLDVKELSDKIIRELPKENAYFVKLTFQELHVCLVIRAL